MADVFFGDDDHLLAELAEAVRAVRPVAERIAAHAVQLYTWRTVDEDLLLAGLTFDSDADGAEADPVHSTLAMRADTGDVRILVFDAPRLSVELEVAPDQIAGQLIPPAAALVVVEGDDGELARIEADERGFFLVAPLPSGRVRLRCDTSEGRVVTAWVEL